MTISEIDESFSMSFSFFRTKFSLIYGVAVVTGVEFMELRFFLDLFVITNHQRLYKFDFDKMSL